MCSLCGDLSDRPDWTQTAGGDDAARARHRAACLAHARALLRTRGLVLAAWQRRYVVGNGRGRSIVVDHLSACWVAAEALTGDPVDPLAPAAIEALRGGLPE
jgi:hypothetical protein